MGYESTNPEKIRHQIAEVDAVDVRTLTGDLTGTSAISKRTGRIHVFDPGGASREVDMFSPKAEDKGLVHTFYNSADAAEDLVIYQADSSTAIATVGQNQSLAIVWNGTTWSICQRGGSSLTASADTISEVTPGAGVTVDGVLLKDGDLIVTDSNVLKFGTPGTDVVFTADGTDVVVSGTGVLYTVDSMSLAIGTGKDIAISWDGTRLNVTQATVNSEIRWGIDGAGIDQVWYGDTASASMTWDQSADSLILAGVAKIKCQTIAAATGTAIPVTHSGSFPITQNGAETNTLADPTFLGQWLTIFVDTDTSGARVITAASRINQAGNTIMTFTEVGDFIKLEAITIAGALKWQVVANDGAALS